MLAPWDQPFTRTIGEDLQRMTVFRLAGDASHALAWAVLLLILCCSRSAAGLSLRTQELLLLVYAWRYQDLAWNFLSLYNWCTKLAYLSLAVCVVSACHCVPALRRTRNYSTDLRPLSTLLLLVLPSLLLGYATSMDRTSPFENLWASSLYLEAVAAVPQLVLIVREGSSRSAVSHYIFLLALYRAFYLGNWAQRYRREPYYWQPQAWTSGAVQTFLYVPFFIVYCRAKLCCLRPHARVQLTEIRSLLRGGDETGGGAAEGTADGVVGGAVVSGPALEHCKFRCPSCGTDILDMLRPGRLSTVRCKCGEAFQVNLEPQAKPAAAAGAKKKKKACFGSRSVRGSPGELRQAALESLPE